MKRKANHAKIQKRLASSSQKRKRLVVFGVLGMLFLYFGPKLGLILATWAPDNVLDQELPKAENKIALDGDVEKILSIVLFKDEIMIHEGKEMGLLALQDVDNFLSLENILNEKSKEPNTNHIHLVKFDSATTYEHVEKALDLVVKLYDKPLYAVERFRRDEYEKISSHLKNR